MALVMPAMSVGMFAASPLRTGGLVVLGVLILLACVTMYQWWSLRR